MNQIYFRQALAVLEKAGEVRVGDILTFNFTFDTNEDGVEFIWEDSSGYEFSIFVPVSEFVQFEKNKLVFTDAEGEPFILNLFVKMPLDISQALGQ